MAVNSAGIIVYRKSGIILEILLVHPGGPFWAGKDAHAWSIPKGEFRPPEDAFLAARREFREETGMQIEGEFIEMEPVRQPGGKIIYSWAIEKNIDIRPLRSNTFTMEWPPHSNKLQDFPEIDKAAWFSVNIAKNKVHKGQVRIIENLLSKLGLKE